ncbi:protein DBF4 homolog B isoform X4 [Taeniopygia guttata]|uniref:protein DBF4 homolog B isoform X4 n=1 Tax=Taeniopygia guttata TaxID=59729 RepID=UPI003BB98D45
MSGSDFLVTICSKSLGHPRISWSVWKERRNVIAASSPWLCGSRARASSFVQQGSVSSGSDTCRAALFCLAAGDRKLPQQRSHLRGVQQQRGQAGPGQGSGGEAEQPSCRRHKIHELSACCPQRHPSQTLPEATIHCAAEPGKGAAEQGHEEPGEMPCLQIQNSQRQFRPFHHQFQSFPDLNFLAPKSSSPFEPLKYFSISCQARGAEGCALHSAGGKSPRSTHVPRKRRGFCECCQETFEELQKHLQSAQHQRFAQDSSQYIPVDRVISQLTNSFVEWSAKVPWSCLADERVVPQAHSTGGMQLLPAELGKEGEQPEQGAVELVMDTELDHGLKSQGHSPCLPRDRIRDPRGGGGLPKHSSLQLPRGAGLSRGVHAAPGTMGEAGLGASGLGLAPELGWGPRAAPTPVREAMASSSEPHTQPGSVSHPPQAQPASRKRQLCSRQSSPVGKRPRLELGLGLSPLGEQMEPVGGGMGAQGAGQVSEPALPAVLGAGSLPLGTELSSRPHSSLAVDLCLCESPGEPASQPGSPGAVAAGLDAGEAAAASTVSECGWSRERPQGRQCRGDSDNTPRDGSSTSCPAGCLPSPTLPVAAARCCCSLRVRAAEAAPGAPDVPRQGTERAQSPGAAHTSSRSSSGSDWDVQLLPSLSGVQGCRIPAVDRDLLQQRHVSVRDSGYKSQLCSVLKESELAWAGREDKNCRNCCTETRGASFPIPGTLFGS